MPYSLMLIAGATGLGGGPAPESPSNPVETPAHTVRLKASSGAAIGANDVAIGTDKRVYMCLESRHVVVRVDPTTSNMVVVAGVWDTAGFAGDGGAANVAQLNFPSGIAIDPTNGDLYIADRLNHRIRKVTTGGIITTVAGTGVATNTGDGGPPSGATLIQPYSITFANGGTHLWILGGNLADYAATSYVRLINAGVITTTVNGATLSAFGPGGRIVGAPLTDEAVLNVMTGNVTKKVDPAGGFANWVIFNLVSPNGIGFDPYLGQVLSAGNTAGGTIICAEDFDTPPNAEAQVTGSAATSGDGTSVAPSLDGTDASVAQPFGSAANSGLQKVLADQEGNYYLITTVHLFKFVRVGSVLESPSGGLGLVRTTTPGFDDASALALLTSLIPASVVEDQSGSGFRSIASLFAFCAVGSVNQYFVGSSYANEDVKDLEESTLAYRDFCQTLVGLYGLDFLTLGGGNGLLYGSDAPRIRCRNKNGIYLIERWLNGSTVNDYGVVLSWNRSFGITFFQKAYIGGIRDISTKAAAFVAGNTLNPAYSAVMSSCNAVLVHCTYPSSLPDAASFVPTTSNTKVMKLLSVSGIHPVAP